MDHPQWSVITNQKVLQSRNCTENESCDLMNSFGYTWEITQLKIKHHAYKYENLHVTKINTTKNLQPQRLEELIIPPITFVGFQSVYLKKTLLFPLCLLIFGRPATNIWTISWVLYFYVNNRVYGKWSCLCWLFE